MSEPFSPSRTEERERVETIAGTSSVAYSSFLLRFLAMATYLLLAEPPSHRVRPLLPQDVSPSSDESKRHRVFGPRTHQGLRCTPWESVRLEREWSRLELGDASD